MSIGKISEQVVLDAVQSHVKDILKNKIEKVTRKAIEEDIKEIVEEIVEDIIKHFIIYEDRNVWDYQPKVVVNVIREDK